MDSNSIKGIKILCNCTGVVVYLDDGGTLYLGADEARLRLASIADLFVLAVIEVDGE